mmetsp:Transcript_17537/g.58759  ORF Transcript_17537/g.58759 Transcript_17537/m.58759 type:complete len:190 (-) Transcript_17537:1346-1915(-)
MGYVFFSRKKNLHKAWGSDLRRERTYGISCAAMAIAGLWAVTYAGPVYCAIEENGPGGQWPFWSKGFMRLVGVNAILQAPLSYASDVLYADVRSYTHVGDRAFALLNTLLLGYLEVTLLLFSRMDLVFKLAMLILVICGVGAHMQAKRAIVRKSYEDFVTLHSFWHFALSASFPAPLHMLVFGLGLAQP